MTGHPLPPERETKPPRKCRCTGRELANGHNIRCPHSTREPYLVELAAGQPCECGLPTASPAGAKWWRPDLDTDPGPSVRAVVRHGEEPELRRAVRRPDGSGWSEYGAMVNYYHDITPPMPWSRTGTCWADTPHPVVAVHEEDGKGWVVDA